MAKLDIVRHRKIWYLISLLVIIPGIVSLLLNGLNLGIDFTGGNILDVKFSQTITENDVRDVLENQGLENSSIQISGQDTALIKTRVLTEEQRADLVNALRTDIGDLTLQRDDIVGPVIGKELTQKALLALAIAAVLMVIYITWRFEFKFGIAAIIALMHDVFVTLGIFSILQIEIDSAFIAAILTIIGYSINDTIVIFDRIRENWSLRKKGEQIEDIVNRSVYQTMTRSINTVLAVLFVLVALYVVGGATIKNFVLAMIIGVVSGAYSSIFDASQIWVDLKKWGTGKKKTVHA